MDTIVDVIPTKLGLAPIQGTRTNVSAPGPLNIGEFFQGQNLQIARDNQIINQRSLDLRERGLNLREREMVFEIQNKLFDDIGAVYDEAYGTQLRNRKQNQQRSYGIDPIRFADDLTKINSYVDEARQRSFDVVRSLDYGKADASQIAQARVELKRINDELNRNLRDNTRFREISRFENFNNQMWDDIYEARKKNPNLEIDPTAMQAIQDEYDRYATQDMPVSRSLFDPSKVLFDKEKARTNIDTITDRAVQSVRERFTESDDPALRGLVETIEYTDIIEPEEAIKIAKKEAALDPNIMGYARTLASQTGISVEEALDKLIRTSIEGKDRFNITKSSVQNLPKESRGAAGSGDRGSELTGKAGDAYIGGYDTIKSYGGDPERFTIPQLQEIGAQRSSDVTINEDGSVTYRERDGDGDLTGETVTIRPSGKTTRTKTTTTPSPEGGTTGTTSEETIDSEGGGGRSTGLGDMEFRQGNNSRGIDFRPIRQSESSQGKNIVAADDAGKPSVGELQLNGNRVDQFLDDTFINAEDMDPDVVELAKETKRLKNELQRMVDEKKEAATDVERKVIQKRIDRKSEQLADSWRQLQQADPEFSTKEEEWAYEKLYKSDFDRFEKAIGGDFEVTPKIATFIADMANQQGYRSRNEILDRAAARITPDMTEDKILDILAEERIAYKFPGTFKGRSIDEIVDQRTKELRRYLGGVADEEPAPVAEVPGEELGIEEDTMEQLPQIELDPVEEAIIEEYQGTSSSLNDGDVMEYLADPDRGLAAGVSEAFSDLNAELAGKKVTIDGEEMSIIKAVNRYRRAKDARDREIRKLDKLEEKVRALNKERELEGLGDATEDSTEPIPTSVELRRPIAGMAPRKQRTAGQLMREYNRQKEAVSEKETELENTIPSEDLDNIKATILANKLPKEIAYSSYRKYATDIAEMLNNGEEVVTLRGVAITRSKYPDDFIARKGSEKGQRLNGYDELVEFIAENFAADAFDAYPPELPKEQQTQTPTQEEEKDVPSLFKQKNK